MSIRRSVLEDSGFIYAFTLDCEGGAKSHKWQEIKSLEPAQHGVLWVHMDYSEPDAAQWLLSEESGLDGLVADALVAEETRPRVMNLKDGLLIAFRGINLNPDSDAEDMVSIRMWVNRDRIISSICRNVRSATEIAQELEKGAGPCSSGQFLAHLSELLTAKIDDTVEDLDERLASIEDEVLSGENPHIRTELAALRRKAIMLRRFMAPQREAMTRLHSEKISWLDDESRMVIHEATDRLTRHIEELDSIRDRAIVVQEELAGHLSEQMNKRMYVLSLIAAIFLPMGFLTGLLGVNVGGVPGAGNVHAFWIFAAMLFMVVMAQVVIFKWKKWL